MAKIDINKTVHTLKGEPFHENGKELTYQDIFLTVLSRPIEKEKNENSLKRYKLGLKCVADTVELDLDERKLLKDAVGEAGFSPVIYGRICDLLEG